MVSRLVSHVQLLSTELALKAIEKHQAATRERPDCEPLDLSQSPHPTLPKPDAPSLADKRPTLSLVQPTPAAEANGDGATVALMETLKKWLAELSADPTSSAQGKAMSQALTLGTLKVFDPIGGVVISAWDVSTALPAKILSSKIEAVGWSQFLKQHVKRKDGLSYAKDADGSYVDLITGESAFFGAVANKFHYFTWPKPNTQL
ncbi:hypothetical protein [Agrobacterium rosae]|uniref:hypothetical protein n=1 Tax=Agrobacterium rosae TaxID=1972867 RepID=UPI003A8082FE